MHGEGGKKVTERIRERDCGENVDQSDGTGWLRNSIHGNTQIINITSVPPLPESNMLKVTHLLSHSCHKYRIEETIKY